MTIPHRSPAADPGAASPIRLMAVDDHPIYRGGLAALIAAYPDLQLVAEAANGRDREEVASAIRQVHAGGRAIPSDVAQRLAAFTPRIDLTEREIEVLGHMANGLSNKEIGTLLGRTEATIKVHVLHILRKLEAADRTEAFTIGLQRGIIHLP